MPVVVVAAVVVWDEEPGVVEVGREREGRGVEAPPPTFVCAV